MHSSLQREIPEFLLNTIVYCDNLTYKKHEKSCFVLTKDLKFYEFRKKQLLHSIDLSETCLADYKQRIQLYDGRKCKWFGSLYINDTTSLQMDTSALEQSCEIKFEKYIYKNFDVNKLYLMIRCWDKLIILQRSTNTTAMNVFRVVAEYENVQNIKLIPSTLIKYQAVVKIYFSNGNISCTNFEENEGNANSSNESNILEQKSEFKQMLERVRFAKAELQFHKEMTHKQFQSLRNKQTFGNNFLRSTNLEENPMLSRCGDVWIRITSSDELVIGIPLVNNCAPPNLTILKNLCPVLSTIPTAESSNMNYEYRVYQLNQTFENLEALESFFENDNIQLEQNSWIATTEQILPTSFAVLLIKCRLSQLMFIDEKCQIFVRFHIEKNLQMDKQEQPHNFEQHLFIKSLDFQEVLHRRQDYEISFSEKTLHQDFLTLAITSFQTQLQIDFSTCADGNKFEKLLAHKFDFQIVHRENRDVQNYNNNEHMEVDEETFKDCKIHPCTLFYNRKPSSLWFGALIKRHSENQTSNDYDSLETTWTFFNKNEEKAFLMFKLIFSELITHKCNVLNIKHGRLCQSSDNEFEHFENAMRQELSAFLDLINNKYERDELIEKMKLLLQLQYNTDILAAEQLS